MKPEKIAPCRSEKRIGYGIKRFSSGRRNSARTGDTTASGPNGGITYSCEVSWYATEGMNSGLVQWGAIVNRIKYC